MAALNVESAGMAVPLNPPSEVIAQDINRHHERRDAAQARALTPGWKTTEFWLTVMIAIGGFSAPVLTLQTMVEQLAALRPEWKALAIIGTVLGGIAMAMKAIGNYAQARAAVKTGIRMMALALALGLAMPTSALASKATFLGTPHHTLAGETSSLLDHLDLGASFGVELRLLGEDRHIDARPALQVLGGLGLADVGPVQLAVVTGGQFVLGAQGGDVAYIFGASAGWRRGPVKLGVFAGAAFRGTQSLVTGFIVSG